MSETYKREDPSFCIICCGSVGKGDKIEAIKPKSGRRIYAHAECYEKEKAREVAGHELHAVPAPAGRD